MQSKIRKIKPTQLPSGNFGSVISRTMANKQRKIENPDPEEETEEQAAGAAQEAQKAEMPEKLKGKGSIISKLMVFKQAEILKNESK
jgi:hypothetical protein